MIDCFGGRESMIQPVCQWSDSSASCCFPARRAALLWWCPVPGNAAAAAAIVTDPSGHDSQLSLSLWLATSSHLRRWLCVCATFRLLWWLYTTLIHCRSNFIHCGIASIKDESISSSIAHWGFYNSALLCVILIKSKKTSAVIQLLKLLYSYSLCSLQIGMYRARHKKSNPLGKIRYLWNCSKFFLQINSA